MKGFISLPNSRIPYLHSYCLNIAFLSTCSNSTLYLQRLSFDTWPPLLGTVLWKSGLIITTVFIVRVNSTVILMGNIPKLVRNVLSCFRSVAIIPILQSHEELVTGAFFLEARAVKRGMGGLKHPATCDCRREA